ncbi:SAM-dependent methyltransferase [Persicobacter psychrovividus]|uniref:Type 11 methyltransferase n=1 Tax=Persicobacter psychrovividus TaxID=387638 RepID=A0ABM7VDE9_9BACT|nr:type 11 methyltransferase [Persicobacter psychrovividus]
MKDHEIKAIHEAYDQTEWIYRLVWRLGKSYAMNYGYWETDTKNIEEAILNLRLRLATTSKVDGNAHILDAGCGYGGTAVWLAKRYGCKVTGITLSDRQLSIANDLAHSQKVQHLVNFVKADYHQLPFSAESFTHYWALESVFHCQDLPMLLSEIARVLQPLGRLMICDYWQSEHVNHHPMLERWFKGYHIKRLADYQVFRTNLTDLNFSVAPFEDYTNAAFKSSQRLYLLGKIGKLSLPLHAIFPKKFRITKTRVESVIAQHEALVEGLWKYGVLTAQKNEVPD